MQKIGSNADARPALIFGTIEVQVSFRSRKAFPKAQLRVREVPHNYHVDNKQKNHCNRGECMALHAEHRQSPNQRREGEGTRAFNLQPRPALITRKTRPSFQVEDGWCRDVVSALRAVGDADSLELEAVCGSGCGLSTEPKGRY